MCRFLAVGGGIVGALGCPVLPSALGSGASFACGGVSRWQGRERMTRVRAGCSVGVVIGGGFFAGDGVQVVCKIGKKEYTRAKNNGF